jgi:hypothetical protein
MTRGKVLGFLCCTVLLLLLIPFISCGGSTPGTFEQILSIIPNTENNSATVAINNYVEMRRQLNIEAPEKYATIDEQIDYINALCLTDGTENQISLASSVGFINPSVIYLQQSLETMSNMGLGYWSIDQEARVGWPPSDISIIKGQFDPGKCQQTLIASSKNDPPKIETYGENAIYSWLGDYEVNLSKRFAPPVYDNLGRGGRFVFQEGYAFRTNGTPPLKSVLDTQASKISSLAEVPEFNPLAREFSSYHAISVLMSDQTQNLAYFKQLLAASIQATTEDVDLYLKQGPLLKPYRTIGLGIAKDKKGLYGLIVLVHADEQTAKENVNLLQRRIDETSIFYSKARWSSLFSDVSISSNGRVLTAKLYGPDIGIDWLKWYTQRYPLVIFE